MAQYTISFIGYDISKLWTALSPNDKRLMEHLQDFGADIERFGEFIFNPGGHIVYIGAQIAIETEEDPYHPKPGELDAVRQEARVRIARCPESILNVVRQANGGILPEIKIHCREGWD